MSLDPHPAREDTSEAFTEGGSFIPFPTHQRALSAMVAGVHAGVPLQALISLPGLGKTAVLNRLCQALRTFRCWSFRMSIKCSESEFYRYALAELGGNAEKAEVGELRKRFLALTAQVQSDREGFLVIFDEAQNLSDAVLLEVAQLVQISPARPQIIVAGRERFADMLRDPRHATLRLSASHTYTLAPLTAEEVGRYVAESLRAVGHDSTTFSADAIALIAEASRGVPRVINNICWTVMRRSGRTPPFGSDDISQVLRSMEFTLPGTPVPHMRRPANHQEDSMRSPPRREERPQMTIADALHTWLRDGVRWKGTAGELLAQLQGGNNIPHIPARELVDHLVSERSALAEKGISVEFSDPETRPQIISLLRFDRPKVSPPDESPAPAVSDKQPQAEPPKQRTPSRWHAVHLWILGAAVTIAGLLTSIHSPQLVRLRAASPRSSGAAMLSTRDTHGQRGSSPIVANVMDPQEESRAQAPVSPPPDKQATNELPQTSEPPSKTRTNLADPATVNRLRRAAASGDPESQYRLGLALAVSDKLEAYKWFVISHAAGWQPSLGQIQRLTPQLGDADIGKVRYEIAMAYAHGNGAPRDLTQAYIWMTLAKAAGVPNSVPERQRIEELMTPEQIADASHKADAWLARTR